MNSSNAKQDVTKYIVRAVKYFVYLMILYITLLNLAALTGTMSLEGNSSVYGLIFGQSGRTMLYALIALSLFQPKFGFIKREHAAHFINDREAIIHAFEVNGMRLQRDSNDEMIFIGSTILRRLRLLYEDKVTVRPTPSGIKIQGARRIVSYVIYRLVI